MRIGVLLFFIFLVFILHVKAQSRVTLAGELRNLYDVSLLPLMRSGTSVEQISTWDTTGGNNDGFAGTYSFVRRNADSSLVIFEAKGPGVLHRIWTPTPTTDTLDFYIDNDQAPTLSVCYTDLFSGNVFPFVAPLCGNAVGGYYCYFPVLYQRSCKVICRGKKLQFHQFQYRSLAKGTTVKKFSSVLNDEERKALAEVAAMWKQEELSRASMMNGSKQMTIDVQLKSKQSATVVDFKNGGRITGIEWGGHYKDLRLRITYDKEQRAAIDCELGDFLGLVEGQPAMKSVVLGADSSKGYCYLPMPFDQRATIELINESAIPSQTSVAIYYTEQRRDRSREGKLYAINNYDTLDEHTPYHVFLNTSGRGHYIGTILQAEGIKKGETPFFEGDDTTAVDGKMIIHGTGSEDYFNGGWYDIKGRWDTVRTLPLHGCLGYSREQAKTGGYRFYLNDKIPFDKHIYHAIEHGRTAKGEPAIYRSVALWYLQ